MFLLPASKAAWLFFELPPDTPLVHKLSLIAGAYAFCLMTMQLFVAMQCKRGGANAGNKLHMVTGVIALSIGLIHAYVLPSIDGTPDHTWFGVKGVFIAVFVTLCSMVFLTDFFLGLYPPLLRLRNRLEQHIPFGREVWRWLHYGVLLALVLFWAHMALVPAPGIFWWKTSMSFLLLAAGGVFGWRQIQRSRRSNDA